MLGQEQETEFIPLGKYTVDKQSYDISDASRDAKEAIKIYMSRVHAADQMIAQSRESLSSALRDEDWPEELHIAVAEDAEVVISCAPRYGARNLTGLERQSRGFLNKLGGGIASFIRTLKND